MAGTTPFPSYHSWYKALFSAQQGTGFAIEMASRLVSRGIIEREPQAVADAVIALGEAEWMYVSLIIYYCSNLDTTNLSFHSFVAGGAVSKIDPNAMGVNPSWRTALIHLVWAQYGAKAHPQARLITKSHNQKIHQGHVQIGRIELILNEVHLFDARNIEDTVYINFYFDLHRRPCSSRTSNPPFSDHTIAS